MRVMVYVNINSKDTKKVLIHLENKPCGNVLKNFTTTNSMSQFNRINGMNKMIKTGIKKTGYWLICHIDSKLKSEDEIKEYIGKLDEIQQIMRSNQIANLSICDKCK
jgi:hypothetical protein